MAGLALELILLTLFAFTLVMAAATVLTRVREQMRSAPPG
jgi:hypothetical protein